MTTVRLFFFVIGRVLTRLDYQLLKDSDYAAFLDYPTLNKRVMSEYRQQLRDFPTVWSAGVPFPEKPVYNRGVIFLMVALQISTHIDYHTNTNPNESQYEDEVQMLSKLPYPTFLTERLLLKYV